MTEKEIFMHVKELGDLYLSDVLLEYIYPRAFICKDVSEDKYLFYEVSSKDNKDIWLVAKVTEQEYRELLSQKMPIQKAYKSENDVFSISKVYGNREDKIELAFDAETWLDKLPKKLVFSESKLIDEFIASVFSPCNYDSKFVELSQTDTSFSFGYLPLEGDAA